MPEDPAEDPVVPVEFEPEPESDPVVHPEVTKTNALLQELIDQGKQVLVELGYLRDDVQASSKILGSIRDDVRDEVQGNAEILDRLDAIRNAIKASSPSKRP